MIALTRRQGIAAALVLAVMVALPAILPQFWLVNIVGRAMVFGIIAMSLTFLATYGGMISLAQMMVAGVAGYIIAITAPTAIPAGAGWPYWFAIPVAIVASTVAGLIVGAIAVRTQGIYLLMITLALAVGFSLFVLTNIAWFNGYEGIRNVLGPSIFGVPFRDPLMFYYLTLAASALLMAFVLYLVRTPFGLVLQGLRDNPRRISALGYNAALHRIAAFGVAGFIAGIGGVISVFYNIGIAPGSIGMGATTNVLIMSVIGGLGHPVGAFIGAFIFIVFDTFAADLYDRNRFNTLIGLVFLVIVLFSPDGVLGLAKRLRGFFASTAFTQHSYARQGHAQREARPAE